MEPGVTKVEPIVFPAGYAEHAPPPDLAPYVACFWSGVRMSETAAPRVHRVLPDGCVDILVDWGDASGGVTGDMRDAVGVGPMTKPLYIAGPSPRLYLGVRFKPGCAYVALGIPASELTDDSVAYAALSRDSASDLSAIAHARTDQARLDAMIELVRRRLDTSRAVPRSVRAAVRTIIGAHGDLRVAALAADIGVTRQQLARQFSIHVGVSPKMLARVMRTRSALARADAARAAYPCAVDWSAIALELGYYDQPHFIDDFKALTGSTPAEWSAVIPSTTDTGR